PRRRRPEEPRPRRARAERPRPQDRDPGPPRSAPAGGAGRPRRRADDPRRRPADDRAGRPPRPRRAAAGPATGPAGAGDTPAEKSKHDRAGSGARSGVGAAVLGAITGNPARSVVAVISVIVLLVTGFTWRSVDSLRSNLTVAAGLGLGGAEDGAIDILVVGVDSRTDAQGRPLSQQEVDMLHAGDVDTTSTDTIMLIRIPTDGTSATAVSIPRDTYTEVPGLGQAKINSAYGSTRAAKLDELIEAGTDPRKAEAEATEAGRQALITSVADLTGVTVDHFAEVGLLGFVLLTDAVGGVDVCLNEPVDEPMSGARFDAGPQRLTGSEAL